ncbi:hypothetical protein BDN72DRAFT_900448 [Pluteus cervinus]|uniref:Uncharacterized protein n=1 Tax=Pluteus cervinus TaxID=181527 RepID=A0ACD3AIQ2_9AGAR|nr:hypothetical protein BDN72DRAFT_900448 [Pluteus cervinus]
MPFVHVPKISLRLKSIKKRRGNGNNLQTLPAVPVASASDEFVEPRLPAELEQIIFTYALGNSLRDATSLFLVARRVHEWLASIVFSVVIQTPTRTFPTKMNQAKLLRYGKHIKHLAIDKTAMKHEYDPEISYYISASEILRRTLPGCVNLVDLALSGGKGFSLFPVLPTLPLTHLTIQLSLLLDQLQSHLLPRLSDDVNSGSQTENPSPLVPLPVFPGITHLHAHDGPVFTSFKTDIQTSLLATHFPTLTHMAVTDVHAFHQTNGIRQVLQKCTKLEVLVWWTQTERNHVGKGSLSTMDFAPPSIDDPEGRIVRVKCGWVSVWEAAARGRDSEMWDIADATLKFGRTDSAGAGVAG